MFSPLIEKARDFAITAHEETNHLYDNKPYSLHLIMVVDIAKKYIDIIPNSIQEKVLSACWLHDTIEDCRLTYNDIQKEFGTTVAEIVYAVTNEKGKNRKERANDKYYRGIRNTEGATFVKMCDRLANIKYSSQQKSRMLDVYRKEHADFIDILLMKQSSFIKVKYLKMFDEMDGFFNN